MAGSGHQEAQVNPQTAQSAPWTPAGRTGLHPLTAVPRIPKAWVQFHRADSRSPERNLKPRISDFLWESGSLTFAEPPEPSRFVIPRGPPTLAGARPLLPSSGSSPGGICVGAGELRAGSEAAFVVGYEPVWQACGVMSGAGTGSEQLC